MHGLVSNCYVAGPACPFFVFMAHIYYMYLENINVITNSCY